MLLFTAIVPLSRLGSGFMPAMGEGTLLYMPTALPGLCRQIAAGCIDVDIGGELTVLAFQHGWPCLFLLIHALFRRVSGAALIMLSEPLVLVVADPAARVRRVGSHDHRLHRTGGRWSSPPYSVC